jgi:hypothetical protein
VFIINIKDAYTEEIKREGAFWNPIDKVWMCREGIVSRLLTRRFPVDPKWLPIEQRESLRLRCIICRHFGHFRANCPMRCKDAICALEKIPRHSYRNCPAKLTPENPRWKMMPADQCTCSDRHVCNPCKYACCTNAIQIYCICDYSKVCSDHDDGKRICYGMHHQSIRYL